VSAARTLRADVADFLEHIETVRNLSAHTCRAYRGDLDELAAGLRALGAPRSRGVDLFLLRRYLTGLRERRLSPRSVARKISAIRAFFRWLTEAGRLPSNPADGLRLPKRGRSLPRVLSQDEVRALLESAPEDEGWRAQRDQALLETLYSTGARVSELAGLSLGDLDLHDGSALLKGKGRRERLAGLGRPCIAAIEAYLEALADAGVRRDRHAVFLNHRGTRLTARSIARVLEQRVAAAGLRGGVSPHTLRHSFATHMLQAGANLREVQELLGHRSVASTQIYTHLTLDHLMRVYETAHPRAGRKRGR
jgi:integrase/recombinase XerC